MFNSKLAKLHSDYVELKPQKVVEKFVVCNRLQKTQKVFLHFFNPIYKDFCTLDFF